MPRLLTLTSSMKRNAGNSPLLKLPRELRDKIYIEVLGERKVQIKRTEIKHNKPKVVHFDDLPGLAELLNTSRQIYAEAHPFFWSTFWSASTFCFTDHLSFSEWIKKRNGDEKGAMRSLSFAMDLGNHSGPWRKSAYSYVTKQLTGVTDLHLEIHLFKFRSDFDFGNNPDFLDDTYAHDPDLAPVRNLALLPLTKAKVEISPNLPQSQSSSGGICTEADQWTESQRQQYADVIKRMLLDPDPAGTEARLKAERVAKTDPSWP